MENGVIVALIIVIVALVAAIIVISIVLAKYKKTGTPDERLKAEEAAIKARIDEMSKRYEREDAELKQRYNERLVGLSKEYDEKRNANERELQNQIKAQQEYLQKLKQDAEASEAQAKYRLKFFEDLQAKVVDHYLEEEKNAKNIEFHKISLDAAEKSDISKLRPVAEQLSKPIILYKLIYEIYYKPKLDTMFKQVLSSVEAEGGIYKITNINDGRVYIGRATKFLDRWRQHAKCGAGADNGSQINVKLYEAMKKEGIENFTFEVLDECSTEYQPLREKYWIDYYRSTEYGYNIKSGG